jgi:peptidoglycan-associated lipoprotein
MKAIPLTLAIACITAGCSSDPVKEPSQAAGETPRVVRSYPATTLPASPPPVTAPAPKPRLDAGSVNDPNSLLSKRTVYYDFDSADIKDEYKPMIRAHAGYLSANRGAKVRIEGNCDERGSREYNLALGQRRAEAVKAAMKLLGTAEAQIETVSWGEEKPKADGHGESAWAENRHSDIFYEKIR